jgi:hypothetical protein
MKNDKSMLVPPKTVIFQHPAVVFSLDENIRNNAKFIKEYRPEYNISEDLYYADAIGNAAVSDKLFIVINYNPVTAGFFELLFTDSRNNKYMDWNFIAFFHDGEAPGIIQERQNIPDGLKRNVLLNISNYAFIVKYTITPGYTVTEQDIKAINEFLKEPEDIESFEEILTNSHEPPFPFYDSFVALRELYTGNGYTGYMSA